MTITLTTYYFMATYKSSPRSANESVAIAAQDFDEALLKLKVTLGEHKEAYPESDPVIIGLVMQGGIVV